MFFRLNNYVVIKVRMFFRFNNYGKSFKIKSIVSLSLFSCSLCYQTTVQGCELRLKVCCFQILTVSEVDALRMRL